MRHHPAEGACSTQTPQSSGGTGGAIPAAREQDFTQMLLFLKKSPQNSLSLQSHASVTHDLFRSTREGKKHSLGNVIWGTVIWVDISP